MDRNNVPEPYKSRIKKIKKEISGPCIGIIRRIIRASPTWEVAQVKIAESLDQLHKDSYVCQKLLTWGGPL